jgi:hypothetical protein
MSLPPFVEEPSIGITFARNMNRPRRNGSNHFLTDRQRHKLTRDLSDRFQVCVATEVDAEAVLLAEAKWGAQKGKLRLMCIEVGRNRADVRGVATLHQFDSWGLGNRPCPKSPWWGTSKRALVRATKTARLARAKSGIWQQAEMLQLDARW